MSKKPKKSNTAKWIIALVAIVAGGVLLGYGLHIATSSNKKQTDIANKKESEITNEEFAAENPPEIAEYEGSEAEQKTKKEITPTQEAELKEKAGEEAFVNKAYGYAFIPPRGWYEDPINSEISPSVYYSTYDPTTTELSNDIPGVKFEALVQDNYKDQTLDEWIADGHQYASEVYSSEKITIGPYEAYKEEYDYNGDTITITFIKGLDVYIFSMYGNDDELQKHKEEFNDIINTLVVL